MLVAMVYVEHDRTNGSNAALPDDTPKLIFLFYFKFYFLKMNFFIAFQISKSTSGNTFSLGGMENATTSGSNVSTVK